MKRRIKAKRATKQAMNVKVFQTEKGTQLVMILAATGKRGRKPDLFFFEPNLAAHFGQRVLEAAQLAHGWNVCHTSGVRM